MVDSGLLDALVDLILSEEYSGETFHVFTNINDAIINIQGTISLHEGD